MHRVAICALMHVQTMNASASIVRKLFGGGLWSQLVSNLQHKEYHTGTASTKQVEHMAIAKIGRSTIEAIQALTVACGCVIMKTKCKYRGMKNIRSGC